jgi:hypothetical protein
LFRPENRASFALVIAYRSPENYDPITWVGRLPIYATTIIVALHVACMVAVALLLASGADAVLSRLTFETGPVLRDYQIWRCLTYALVNPPDLWFIISLVMFYIFGRDVEQFLGRRGFIRLYFGFLLLGPSLLLAASLATGQSYQLHQSWANFAVFLSFAALYPGAQLLFQVTAKIFALIILAVSVLQLLASRQWPDLTVLLATAFLAWYAIRHGAAMPLDFMSRLRPFSHRMKQPRLHVLKPPLEEPTDPHGVIDPLLEKISRHGLASLTRRERDQLEKARAMLMEQERH